MACLAPPWAVSSKCKRSSYAWRRCQCSHPASHAAALAASASPHSSSPTFCPSHANGARCSYWTVGVVRSGSAWPCSPPPPHPRLLLHQQHSFPSSLSMAYLKFLTQQSMVLYAEDSWFKEMSSNSMDMGGTQQCPAGTRALPPSSCSVVHGAVVHGLGAGTQRMWWPGGPPALLRCRRTANAMARAPPIQKYYSII